MSYVLYKNITFTGYSNTKLYGILHHPDSATDWVYILSHGSLANKDRKRIVTIADALSKNNIATFRFDFGGCGESQNRPITIRGLREDLIAAVMLMKNNGFTNIGLIGESLGALLSIMVYDPVLIKDMILLAPLLCKIKLFSDDKPYILLQKQGYIPYHKDGKVFKLTREYVEKIENLNVSTILKHIDIPALIIHGGEDHTIPPGCSQRALKSLPIGSKLVIIPSGSHTLDEKIDIVINEILKWTSSKIKNIPSVSS